jgi:hypothetical protein
MTETVNTRDEGEESESERLERKGYSVKIREAVTRYSVQVCVKSSVNLKSTKS